MRLKLRNTLAEGNRVNENDYVDLLDVATEPHHGLNDPLEAWIRPVHLDDEDHGDRKAGHGAIGRHNINSRRRGAPSDQTESSGSDAINLSFESMSIATDHSGHSNESGSQFGYGTNAFNQVGEIIFQTPSWVRPYYPILGGVVGSSQEIYDYHVGNYNSTYMGIMTWFDYCMFVDGRAAYEAPRQSFWM